MLVYAMVQEHATWLNYRNLRDRTRQRGGDPALEQLLMYVAVDEKAHHSFFSQCVALFLKYDREKVLEQMRRVMNDFAMPAIHDLLGESQRRVAQVRALEIFNENIYYAEVYLPILANLGVNRQEMRSTRPRKSMPSPTA
jgi:acyl-[acyl-carrier-protein] desaturase